MKITTAENDIEYILFTEEQIKKRVKEMGEELTEMYKDSIPVMGCVLKGASVFYTDLIRSFNGHMFMDFISVTSYGQAAKSSGTVSFRKDFDNDLKGKDVIIVEDIVDSGLTLMYLKKLLMERDIKSVRTVALLDKFECHPATLSCDLSGFRIDNRFVVGYGLDYAGYYRNLPYIGVLKREVYEDRSKD